MHPEDKNGDNFPDDESVAVSGQVLCITPLLCLYLLPALISEPTGRILLLCCVAFPPQSTDTLRPEQDISPKDGDGCPESRSTDRNADTTTISDASTRPVLNRQGKHGLNACAYVCVCFGVLEKFFDVFIKGK